MSETKYELTDEHRAQLKPWADKWIANAMSTKAMDDEDREAMRFAVRGLYEAANLVPPPDHRIVFVPSPFVLRFAGGFAAAIWHKRKNSADATLATADATFDATLATAAATVATRNFSNSATYSAATFDAATFATFDAIAVATRNATYAAATRDATRDSTYSAATFATAENSEWYKCEIDAASIDRHFKLEGLGVECAKLAHRMWQSGNQWSGWCAYISFFRHIAQLPIDYSKWQHWESAAIHGGPRIMHTDFCMISDRPEVLTVDEQNRPHGENGPFCRWRDGSALYAWHGTRVPAWIIEHPEMITAKSVDAEENLEVRRVMVERMGLERYLQESGAQLIHSDNFGALYRKDMGEDEPIVAVHVVNSTPEPDGSHKKYFIRVPPEMKRAKQAVAWTFEMSEEEYCPEIET